MTERKHCADCALDYSDEAAHTLVHDAVVAATASVPTGEVPQPHQA